VGKRNLKTQKAVAHAQRALQLFGFNYACLLIHLATHAAFVVGKAKCRSRNFTCL